jgi:hypothetical protein
MLKFKAELESSLSWFSFKRLDPGVAFNEGFINLHRPTKPQLLRVVHAASPQGSLSSIVILPYLSPKLGSAVVPLVSVM